MITIQKEHFYFKIFLIILGFLLFIASFLLIYSVTWIIHGEVEKNILLTKYTFTAHFVDNG